MEKIDKQLDDLNPFYNEVILPETQALINDKKAVVALLKNSFSLEQLEVVMSLNDFLTVFLGKEHVFLALILQILVAMKHDDDEDVIKDPMFIVAYASYAATEDWFIKPGFSKRRIKRALHIHEMTAKTGGLIIQKLMQAQNL